MTDLQSLRELAQKATPRDGKWFTEDRIGYHDALTMKSERDFIADCSPDRILAMLDVCEAAAEYISCCKGNDAYFRTPYPGELDTVDEALARLRGAK